MNDYKVTSIYDFSPEALSQLKLWIEQAGIAIPVNQLVGFSQFVAQQAQVLTSESTASTTYTDLTTVGPQLTGLRPGKYVFLFGSLCTGGGTADTQWTSISVDGAAASDNDSVIAAVSVDVESVSRATTATLTNANGATVKMQYRTSGGNLQSWSKRWLIALKYA